MSACYVCDGVVQELLDLGGQPISNRFLRFQSVDEFKHPLRFGYCQNCALAQLLDPAPSDQVYPHFDWIRYNEAEGHLDELVELLVALPGINSDSKFLGVGDKDDTTLARLAKKGFAQTKRLSLDDLNVSKKDAGIETIQEVLTVATAKKITEQLGVAHLVMARHILEHAHQPLEFMNALKALTSPGGYVVFEVPDNTKLFEVGDYSILWEEHCLYFTPYTFLRALEVGGFEVVLYKNYPYSMENSMVVVARMKADNIAIRDEALLKEDTQRLLGYQQRFFEQKERYQKLLSKYQEQGPVALLGAGHLACHFINLMEVADFIDFVVDDHPHKIGLLMPGSQLPILPSTALVDRNIKFCLLSVSQESEARVINNKKDFVEQGGQFYSIFPSSHYALKELQFQ